MDVGFFTLEKKCFKGNGNVFGKADADETAGRNRIAITDQADRLAGGHDLSGIRGTK
jgi:hypothetical protein